MVAVTDPERTAILRSLESTRELETKTYVELGILRARTSMWLFDTLLELRDSFKLVGVDFARRSLRYWNGNIKHRQKPGCTAKFFNMKTSEAAKLCKEPVVWVFVDACHCEECATQDILDWGPKICAGGSIVVHDTTAKRRHYEANFQHYKPNVGGTATRRFGVWEAVQPEALAGEYLRRDFDLIDDIDDINGVQVWRKK